MRLILIEDVFHLGKRGDVVRVADGYGRNYLIPKRLAVPATAGNLKMVEQQRIALAKKEAKLKEEAELLARELEQLHLVFSRRAGETGVLFGSVTSKDIADLLEKEGIHLDRRRVLLEHPLKQIGNYQVEVRPHSEVAVEIPVSILAETEEGSDRVLKKGDESEEVRNRLEAQVQELRAAHQAQAEGAPSEAVPSKEDAAEKKTVRKKKSTSPEAVSEKD